MSKQQKSVLIFLGILNLFAIFIWVTVDRFWDGTRVDFPSYYYGAKLTFEEDLSPYTRDHWDYAIELFDQEQDLYPYVYIPPSVLLPNQPISLIYPQPCLGRLVLLVVFISHLQDTFPQRFAVDRRGVYLLLLPPENGTPRRSNGYHRPRLTVRHLVGFEREKTSCLCYPVDGGSHSVEINPDPVLVYTPHPKRV
jgi:hypothetical protein